jgi:hypothetical protein
VTRTNLRQRSAFLHLAVDQAWLHLPLAHVAASPTHLEPLTKVGRERIKVEIEPVTGEKWEAAWGQALSERVDEPMSHALRAGTELKHRKNLRARIDGQPQPEDLFSAAEPCSQFIQLYMRELEVAEIVIMQRLSVHGLRETSRR